LIPVWQPHSYVARAQNIAPARFPGPPVGAYGLPPPPGAFAGGRGGGGPAFAGGRGGGPGAGFGEMGDFSRLTPAVAERLNIVIAASAGRLKPEYIDARVVDSLSTLTEVRAYFGCQRFARSATGGWGLRIGCCA
jgi:hypothetical protein